MEYRTISEQANQGYGATTRPSKPGLAAFAGIFGLGLGYLYVDRARFAFLPFLTVFGSLATAGWTRLIIEPIGVYIAYSLALTFWLISIIHPAVIAYKTDQLIIKPFNRGWVYVVWIIAFGLIGGQIAKNGAYLFGYEPFGIPVNSMSPTVQRNDLIMVDTWRYQGTSPQINDLVVFDLPTNPEIKYQSRVVGIPNDSVEIRNDVLIRNGEAIVEDFIQVSGSRAETMSNFGPIVVPDEHYFVLGDNRHNAQDSRFIGPIHEGLLHGRVEYRWFARNDGISWSRFPTRLAAAD